MTRSLPAEARMSVHRVAVFDSSVEVVAADGVGGVGRGQRAARRGLAASVRAAPRRRALRRV